MKNEALELVIIAGAGVWFLSSMTRATRTTAAQRQAAVNRRTTAAVVGSGVAEGIGKWFTSDSGQKAIGRAATTIGGWFEPAKASTPPMDWGTGDGWGDDSTAGAVVGDGSSWQDGVYD